MILYHRTTTPAAQGILATGFIDGRSNYLTANEYSGVWVSDVPLDENEGACGDVLLEISVPFTQTELSEYEWVEEGKPYREFLVPASVLNARAQVRICETRIP